MTTQSDESVSEPQRTAGQGLLVIAHRGASKAHPENTVAAFAGAATLGADWVELDVRRTRDDVLVIHHDPELPDGRVIVQTDAAELPASVPTLDAALEVCAANGLGVNVEVKADPTEPDFDPEFAVGRRVAHLLDPSVGPYLVTSFHPHCIDAVKEANGDLATGQLILAVSFEDADKFIARTARRGHDAVNPSHWCVDRAVVDAAHDRGLPIYPWTVDDVDRMDQLIELGVDGIITNTPDVLRAKLTAARG